MSVPAERFNRRTAIKAAIKRGSAQARSRMRELDAEMVEALTEIYTQAREDIEAAILSYGEEENLRLEVLRGLRDQIEGRLDALAGERDALLGAGLSQAAELGTAPLAASVGVDLRTRVAEDAVRFVRGFVAADGLQLSDRLWRVDRNARDAVAGAVEQAVIQGHGASRAAQAFLARGAPVPRELLSKEAAARAGRVARIAGEALMKGDMNPYDQALRVFRTEINRAHGEAYMASAAEDEDVVGFRFMLSPRHPRPDICDLHASVNRYGLGPGVYPSRERCPWPAHPNTLSFVEVVFRDEVTAEDRKGKEDRIAWLKRQSPGVQEGVLGSRRKRAALQRGLLTERQITAPWAILKKRLQRRGIDVENIEPHPAQATRAPSTPPDDGVDPKAVAQVISRGRRNGNEHAVIYDAIGGEGWVLEKTTGNTDHVSFTNRELRFLLDGPRRFDLVHNHPNSSSFSQADIEFAAALPGMRKIWAVGHDDGIYGAIPLVSRETVAQASHLIRRQMIPNARKAVRRGAVPGGAATNALSHLVNVALDRAGVTRYEVGKTGRKLAAALDELGPERVEMMLGWVAGLDYRNGSRIN